MGVATHANDVGVAAYLAKTAVCAYNRLFKFKYTINDTQKFESLN